MPCSTETSLTPRETSRPHITNGLRVFFYCAARCAFANTGEIACTRPSAVYLTGLRPCQHRWYGREQDVIVNVCCTSEVQIFRLGARPRASRTSTACTCHFATARCEQHTQTGWQRSVKRPPLLIRLEVRRVASSSVSSLLAHTSCLRRICILVPVLICKIA